MNENRFTQLFKKYNWEVEELGDNSYIAYNDIYFVPFSCVASTEVLRPCHDKYINGACYLEIDKDEFVNAWKRLVENGYHEAIGYHAINDFYSAIPKFISIADFAFTNYNDFQIETWLERIHKARHFINNSSIKKYNPSADGAILAIRIYLIPGGTSPHADLVFPGGKYTTITWTNVEHRNKYASGITGYTLIYDEREKCEFKEWIK